MRLEDLKYGNVVELRNGERYVLGVFGVHEFFISLNNGICIEFEKYNDNLIEKIFSTNDIVKFYKDYTLKEILWERKEKSKLTNDEKVILRNIDEEFKYIARDNNGLLYIYKNKPDKTYDLCWGNGRGTFFGFKHLFLFINWTDEEPYLIEDLLKEQEDDD